MLWAQFQVVLISGYTNLILGVNGYLFGVGISHFTGMVVYYSYFIVASIEVETMVRVIYYVLLDKR